jgi:hypothetical protein
LNNFAASREWVAAKKKPDYTGFFTNRASALKNFR